MSSTPSPPLPSLSPEIWDHICSFMLKPSLLQLRLASRKMNEIALSSAYKELRLEGFGDSPKRFVKIAKSPWLRDLVRDLTVDTWIGPNFKYNANRSYELPAEFMDALPYLRCFSKVSALHLRFNEFCGDDNRERWATTIEETWPFRYRVLDTVCHCVAGMWTEERQIKIDEDADLDDYVPKYPDDDDMGVPFDQVMPLKELTIANLADYEDPFLGSSEAWKEVLSLPSLVDLKLFITTEVDTAAPENAVYFEEKYEMFENLPYTWLSPSIAGNLRVLSLYFEEFWGWFPKMDFRLIGGDTPFPQLKKLALGQYVFSHQWQIEWLASVGQKNGSFGLEELYLDNCPILFEARQMGPLDSSDPGYPDTSTVMSQSWDIETYKYPLRWHSILSHWTSSMRGLRVFRTGHGPGSGPPNDTYDTLLEDDMSPESAMDVLEHRISDHAHRNFDGPEPIPGQADFESCKKIWATSRYSQGTGMFTLPGCRMQYINYDIGIGSSPYEEQSRYFTADEEAYAPEKETVVKDAAAYKELMSAIRKRLEA